MLKQAIPNVFVKDFEAALAYYTGPLGFHPLFVYGDIPFYAHVARDEAILAIRHVTRPVIDHTAGEALLSAFIEVSDVNALHDLTTSNRRSHLASTARRALGHAQLDRQRSRQQPDLLCFQSGRVIGSRGGLHVQF